MTTEERIAQLAASLKQLAVYRRVRDEIRAGIEQELLLTFQRWEGV